MRIYRICVAVVAIAAYFSLGGDGEVNWIAFAILIACVISFFFTDVRPDLKAGKEAEREEEQRQRRFEGKLKPKAHG